MLAIDILDLTQTIQGETNLLVVAGLFVYWVEAFVISETTSEFNISYEQKCSANVSIPYVYYLIMVVSMTVETNYDTLESGTLEKAHLQSQGIPN